MGTARWVILVVLACARIPGAAPAESPGRESPGTVAILREEGFPARGFPSSPETLAKAFQAAGFETRFLSAAELADGSLLRPDAFRIVVLPYGRSFPAAARESFIAYLRGGGHFISTGGYAFEDLLLEEGGVWLRESEVLERRHAEALAAGRTLLADGGFEKTAASGREGIGGEDLEARWRRTSEACEIVDAEPPEGKRCAQVTSKSVSIARHSPSCRRG